MRLGALVLAVHVLFVELIVTVMSAPESAPASGNSRRDIVGADLHEIGDTQLVPFTNANPHVDTFRMKFRPLVIGSKSYTIQQSMDDRPVELQPLHPGMKWTGAAVWDPAIVLCQYLEKNSHLFQGKRVLEVKSLRPCAACCSTR